MTGLKLRWTLLVEQSMKMGLLCFGCLSVAVEIFMLSKSTKKVAVVCVIVKITMVLSFLKFSGIYLKGTNFRVGKFLAFSAKLSSAKYTNYCLTAKKFSKIHKLALFML